MEDDTRKAATEPSSEDELIRKKEFERVRGLNLDAFMTQGAPEVEPVEANEAEEEPSPAEDDIAMGDMGDWFSAPREGPKNEASGDSVTQLATQAEAQISRSLMVAMVLIWSIIGALVGTVLPPIVSALGLLSMALFGLSLGERWIPRPSMNILGITWVIISMKLLYGLALDAWHWGWFDASPLGGSETLGISMILLVGLNVGLAFRHDEDAVAAQSALVLFAVGSSAGAVYGEQGVAVFIVLSMALMHGLALTRRSGNLASLGIAISYLWVGIHALSNHWTVFSLELIPIENDLTLFLLLALVTAANASMAAVFVHHENWLSSACDALGLGKPGLWAVSVTLGMIGAMMAIAAHRTETGYALAQLILLASAFSASYLVVRGVPWTVLMPYVLAPAPFLLAALALLVTGTVDVSWPWGLEAYSLYAILTAGLTVAVLLQHQTNVSDHVLWMGSIAIVLLLTLLIPAEELGSGSRTLLISQAMIWVGLGALAVMRASPSMAGVAVFGPHLWLLAFASDLETRIISADLLPVMLAEQELGVWLSVLVLFQVGVNTSLGASSMNLANRFSGFSEMSARLRDSNILNLWNLSFFLSILSFLAVVRPGGVTGIGLMIGYSLLLFSHAFVLWRGMHQGKPRTLLTAWCVGAAVFSWRYGYESLWAISLLSSSFLLLRSTDHDIEKELEFEEREARQSLPGKYISLHMGMMAAFFIIIALKPSRGGGLSGQTDWFSEALNLWFLVALAGASLVLFLTRIKRVESLFTPTVGSMGVLVAMAVAGGESLQQGVQLAALVFFVLTGSYLALQGEVRNGLKSLALQSERREEYEAKRKRLNSIVASEANLTDGMAAPLKRLDAALLDLAEKQRKRSKRMTTQSEDDLLVGDIHYRPVLVMMFLGMTFLFAAWIAYTTPNGMEALIFAAVFSVVLIGLARLRANSIGLRLPDTLGIETPIALAMAGAVLVHLASQATVGVINPDEMMHLVVLGAALSVFAGMGLLGRNDLGLRIPSALEGVIGLLVIDRIITLLIGGAAPIPFAVDPFNGSAMNWVLPFVGIEVLLVAAVVLFDWVEGERLKRDLPDHRGALGRSVWLGGCVLLSFGPAALMVLLMGVRRSIAWSQPAVMLAAIVAAPLTLQAFMPWLGTSLGLSVDLYWLTFMVGAMCMAWTVVIVQQNRQIWLSSSLWGAHLMLYPTAILAASPSGMVFAGLALSVAAWLSGIFTLRKSWRIVGAINLAIAWLFAAIAMLFGASSTYLLLILLASAALLFTVTALTESNKAELTED